MTNQINLELLNQHFLKAQAIAGAGGGGGQKQRQPTEEPDTLRSEAYARVLYLLGEGYIDGPPGNDLRKNVFFDDTPIEDSAGRANFEGVNLRFRRGTQTQRWVPGFSAIEAETSVGVKVEQNTPIVRSLSDPNADAVKLRMTVPGLQRIENDGDMRSTSVQFRVEITNNGVYEERLLETISGKTTSPYQFDYRIPLRGNSPWQIRVTRLTADSESSKLQNELQWQAFTAVIETKLFYPNSALLAVTFPASQFRSIPNVSTLQRGLVIQVPHNYNPITRQYSGFFNGSTVSAWTNNPAWILYDLLTSDRYGCGRWIDVSQIDIASFYQIGQYCDGLVPNGKGGWEPRFVCNAYIQNREDAYQVLNTLSSVFRGMLYWAGGSIFATQDAPALPVRTFTEANVVQKTDQDGKITQPAFVYSGSGLRSRHTAALVSWSDPSDRYKTKIEYVEDRDGIQRYGYHETEVVAFGCTSQGQAHRVGEWLLYTERVEGETVTFTCGSEGLLLRPGELINIMDLGRSGWRYGGRVLASTLSTVTLDAFVYLIPGETYTIDLMNVLGQQSSYPVLNPPGIIEPPILNVVGLPNPVPTGTIWALRGQTINPQVFRVISISEKEGTYEVTAIAHNASKYDFIERDQPLQINSISTLANLLNPPNPPGSITATEALFLRPGIGVQVKVTLTWTPPIGYPISEYRLRYRRRGEQDWLVLGSSDVTSFEWMDVPPGIYEFRVRSVNALGTRGPWSDTVNLAVMGKTTPPSNPTGFRATTDNENITLFWNAHPDLDVQFGGKFEIRAAPALDPRWAIGSVVAIAPGNATSVTFPYVEDVTFIIRAFDSGGRISPTNVRTVSSNPHPTRRLRILSQREEEFTQQLINGVFVQRNWRGALTNMTIENNRLKLCTLRHFDQIPGMFDSIPGTFDQMANNIPQRVVSEGTYEIGLYDYQFRHIAPDLTVWWGEVYFVPRVFFERVLDAAAFEELPGNFDSLPGNFDSLTDGTEVDSTWQIEFARSYDDITWSEWEALPLTGRLAIGRFFRFRLRVYSTGIQNLEFTAVRIHTEVQERLQSGRVNVGYDGQNRTIRLHGASSFATPSGNQIIAARTHPYYQWSSAPNITPAIGGTDNPEVSAQPRDNSGVTVLSDGHDNFVVAPVGTLPYNFTWVSKGFGRMVPADLAPPIV